MDGMFAQLAIAMAVIVTPPTAIKTAQPSQTCQENRIDDTHSNGVIYFDAPVHGTPNYTR